MSSKKDNPYSLLILAVPFIAGGIILLFRTTPTMFDSPPGRFVGYRVIETVSLNTAHATGLIGLVIGGFITWFYFKIRDR